MPTHITPKAHFALNEGDNGDVAIHMDGPFLTGMSEGTLSFFCRKGTTGQQAKDIALLLNKYVTDVVIKTK